MDPVEHDLVDGLAAEPSLDRYLVYADFLQTRSDPRGELIALAVHERRTGVVDPRMVTLQAECERQLLAPFEDGGVQIWWELGCPSGVWIAPQAQPLIADWIASPALALVRSFALVDTRSATDVWPVELIANAPFAPRLERLAIGGVRTELNALALGELIDRLPRLVGLEIRGSGAPEALLDRLEAFDRLEELALWIKSRNPIQQRVFAGPWQNLRALTTTGMTSQTTIPSFVEPVIDGTRFPALAELSIHAVGGVGFEGPLIERLDRSQALGKRLRKLGFDWGSVSDATLESARDQLADVELVWPRPTGDELAGRQSYSFARRLRLGMARNRLAVDHARDACDREPRDYFHWAEYGYALGTLDRLPEKLEAMERAIALDPNRWGAHVGKADTLRDLSRFDEAEAEYTAVIAREPDRISLHNGFGLLQARRGNAAQALEAFDRAAALATPGADRALYVCNALEVAIEDGQLATADERFERARADAPDHPRLRRIGGYLRIYDGAPAEALAIAGDPMAGPPTEDEYSTLSLYAAAKRELGDRDAADAAYELIAQADCPAYLAFAWLGQAIAGTRDPLAAFAERDPAKLADAIAARVNAARAGAGKIAHTTEDRCDDRIHVGVCATAAAVAANRATDAHELAVGLAAFLAGPAPVKHNHWWLELAELVHHAVTHAATLELAELAGRTYRIATGRERPSVRG